MNDRIFELAEQAGYAPLPGFDFANELQEVFLKKFAELIVRECIGIIETVEPGYGDYRDQIEDAFRSACKKEIKEYFEVKI